MVDAMIIITYILIILTLAALAYRDNKDFMLPDVLNLGLALCFIAFHTLTDWTIVTHTEALIGMISTGALLLFIRTIANHIYKEDALGLGDIKLMMAAGLGLGSPVVFLTLTLGAALGMLHGILITYVHNKKNVEKQSVSQAKVPAGVGLVVAILMAVVWKFGCPYILN